MSKNSQSNENFEVKEEYPNHYFRTELPNIIEELNLTPAQFRIYWQIKKIAGDQGKCWLSTISLAKKCHLSKKTVERSLPTLCSGFKLLNNKPLIRISNRFKPDGSKDTNLITIVDIWDLNGYFYRPKNDSQIIENKDSDGRGSVKMTLGGSVKMTLGVASKCPYGSVKMTHKEEPSKKNHLEEEIVTNPVAIEIATNSFQEKPESQKREFSKEAQEFTQEFWNYISRQHPKFKPPKFDIWINDFEKLHAIDKREWHEVREVMKWAFDISDFWSKTLQSPCKLRKHYDKLIMQMRPTNADGEKIKKNREFAFKVKNFLAKDAQANQLIIYAESVFNQTTRDSIKLNLPPETFENILMNWFGMSKNRGSNE